VRYEQVNAMLLNEFLEAHQNAGTTSDNSNQQKQIDAFTAPLQKSERTPHRSESVRWRT
jgi:hypothetical protein